MEMRAWQERCTGMCVPDSWPDTCEDAIGVPRDEGIQSCTMIPTQAFLGVVVSQ